MDFVEIMEKKNHKELGLMKSSEVPATVGMLSAFREEFKAGLYRLETKMDRQFEKMDERFQKIDERFQKIDERFQKIDERFQKIDERFQRIDERFEEFEKKFMAVDGRFDLLEKRMIQSMDERFERLILRIEASLARQRADNQEQDARCRFVLDAYSSLNARVERLENKVDLS